MNELLQKHGCSSVFSVPEGLKEIMSDISREVLREQPAKIYEFIANYLSVLMITREHGFMAVKILDDLCDCRPSVSQHLMQIGLEDNKVQRLATIIKQEIEEFEPVPGKETIKEVQIVKRILKQIELDEIMTAKVCQVIRNAYRDYWYRKKLLQKSLQTTPEEPWEIAAQHTLEIYKRTKPSFDELNRAAEKIQAAYKGYHLRKDILKHLKPKERERGPKMNLPGPPLDVAGSRQIEFGPVISLKVFEDDLKSMFSDTESEKLALDYEHKHTVTYVPNVEDVHPVASREQTPRKIDTQELAPTISPSASHMLRTISHEVPEKLESRSISQAAVMKSSHMTRPPSQVSEEGGVPEEVAMEYGDEDEVFEELPIAEDSTGAPLTEEDLIDEDKTAHTVSEVLGEQSKGAETVYEDISENEVEELEDDQ